jgi:anti-sigma factor RsiW
MSCSPFDLRDYFLKELTDPQQRQVEAHVKTCAGCREEMERLRLTEAALFSLREEEIPQRIAFVSDKIFEPSPWRRWWTGFWGSTSRLGFASAAMLSAALVVFALTRPAPEPPVVTVAPPAPVVQPGADIQGRIDTAVARALAASEARQSQTTRQLVAELQEARKGLMIAAAEIDFSSKRDRTNRAASYGPPPQTGEVR